MNPPSTPTGVGLGLRSKFAAQVAEGAAQGRVAFLEVAPENYIDRGGRWPAYLEKIAAVHPIITHGLTMSLGGSDPFDPAYLQGVRDFCQRYGGAWHSDHLCFAGLDGTKLHDLLPVPFTMRSATRTAARVREASAAIGKPLIVENVSQYLRMGAADMTEPEFLSEVVRQADCGLLLDVNNVYVNAQNFGFDVYDWLRAVPLERVRQLHIAGHERWEDYEMWVDTHGATVLPEVRAMMQWVVERIGPVPVLLERDTNIPSLATLLDEVAELQVDYDEALLRHANTRADTAHG